MDCGKPHQREGSALFGRRLLLDFHMPIPRLPLPLKSPIDRDNYNSPPPQFPEFWHRFPLLLDPPIPKQPPWWTEFFHRLFALQGPVYRPILGRRQTLKFHWPPKPKFHLRNVRQPYPVGSCLP